jgi:hypothetical protein
MQDHFAKATLIAAILALVPAAGFAQAPNTAAKGKDAVATGTSQLPERPGHVGGNTVTYPHWSADMNEQQVVATLKAAGYTDIKGVTLKAGTFHVKSAKLNGKKVENLAIDATNGRIRTGG